MNSLPPNPPAPAPVPAFEVAPAVGEVAAHGRPVRGGVTMSRTSVFMLVGLSVLALALAWLTRPTPGSPPPPPLAPLPASAVVGVRPRPT